MKKLIDLSARIYRKPKLKDYRRVAVFLIRSLSRKREMNELIDFFEDTPLRRRLALDHPSFFEQATRQFFYYKSTFAERSLLIREHFQFLESRLSETFLLNAYKGNGLDLWQGKLDDQEVVVRLFFHHGHNKEGLLTVELGAGKWRVYHATFWVQRLDGEVSLIIGALQGAKGGAEIVRDITKSFHGFRPKNTALFGVRAFAAALGIKRILAVSNRGYYAQNHVRLDRKLRSSLDEFWLEAGGRISVDKRFFELPVAELRKSDDEIPPRKRSLYRKRFALLDEIEAGIHKTVSTGLLEDKTALTG
jgi:uncharacterized protein VirK/YbjX